MQQDFVTLLIFLSVKITVIKSELLMKHGYSSLLVGSNIEF